MDQTERKITKIAREVSKFTISQLKRERIGTAEIDFLHVLRKNPGITQAKIRNILSLDKAAAARQTHSLEKKGYLIKKTDALDKRCQLLYATDLADSLKNSKASLEALFYQWLQSDLSSQELNSFCLTLDKLYQKTKNESKNEFKHLKELLNNHESN